MPSIFINREKVIDVLIKERCKLSEKRSKLNQINEFVLSCEVKKSDKKLFKNEETPIFPSRNKWCHLGGKYDRKDLSTLQRNQRSLKYTYIREKRKKKHEEWYINLCHYADHIVRIADQPCKRIDPPLVRVIEKKRKSLTIDHQKVEVVIYRPVCIFKRDFKIIFSLLNKFLTRAFDDYFLPCSYAFRRPKRDDIKLPHLKTVQVIQNYRKEHLNQPLYVAECDMQKFYDTISHDVIKTRFSILFHHYLKKCPLSAKDSKLIKMWFFLYIDCFDFKRHVFLNNKRASNDKFWERKSTSLNGKVIRKIEWVDQLVRIKEHHNKNKNYVGVPQGGALSGLVANIVMHFVDNQVMNSINHQDILYCRFCDDMVLVGVNKQSVENVFNDYQKAIIFAKLFPHPHEDLNIEHMRDFWKGKTRGPYEWGEKGRKTYPWITFVGFDINWQGNLRIRKASVQKQIKKQNTIMSDLILPYQQGLRPRYCSGSILKSLISRLICMSVGRVSIRNFKNHSNTCSWLNAFSILDKNKWSAFQLKGLDRHRSVVYKRAVKQLNNIQCPPRAKEKTAELESEKFVFHGSPFSYFGQCFVYKKDD